MFMCIAIREAAALQEQLQEQLAQLQEQLAHLGQQNAHLVQQNAEKENENQELKTSMADVVEVGCSEPPTHTHSYTCPHSFSLSSRVLPLCLGHQQKGLERVKEGL